MGWHDNAAKQRTEKYIETTGHRNDQIDRQIATVLIPQGKYLFKKKPLILDFIFETVL